MTSSEVLFIWTMDYYKNISLQGQWRIVKYILSAIGALVGHTLKLLQLHNCGYVTCSSVIIACTFLSSSDYICNSLYLDSPVSEQTLLSPFTNLH